MKDLKTLVRPNVQVLSRQPDAAVLNCRRQQVMLDRCESPFNAPDNRFPSAADELRLAVAFARDKRVSPAAVTFTSGATEPLDLLLRTFCIPRRDNIVVADPGPVGYVRLAAINDVECRRVRLSENFDIDVSALLRATNGQTKAIVLSSPNYPTGNLFTRNSILQLTERFDGLVVVDETYVEYARTVGLAVELPRRPNLVVMGNLSAAFASAGLLLGYVLASPEIVAYLNIVKPPYAVATAVVEAALTMLTRRRFDVDKWVKWLLDERTKVMAAIRMLDFCEQIYPTDSNFFLLRAKEAPRLLTHLAEAGIDVADCSRYTGCDNCLGITVGLTAENNALLGALRCY